MRMAISLGLHENPPAGSLSEEKLEDRRRAWWSVYSMDCILSVKSGNPMMMHNEDIGVAMPSPLPSEEVYCPAVVLACYTTLSLILGDIARQIYRRRSWESTGGLKQVMHRINEKLDRRLAVIPSELDFHAAHMSREGVSTMLHF